MDKPLICERQIKMQNPRFENVSFKIIEQICQSQIHWTLKDMEDVMFSEESNFKTIRCSTHQIVRRPLQSNRFSLQVHYKKCQTPARLHNEEVFIYQEKGMNLDLYIKVLQPPRTLVQNDG